MTELTLSFPVDSRGQKTTPQTSEAAPGEDAGLFASVFEANLPEQNLQVPTEDGAPLANADGVDELVDPNTQEIEPDHPDVTLANVIDTPDQQNPRTIGSNTDLDRSPDAQMRFDQPATTRNPAGSTANDHAIAEPVADSRKQQTSMPFAVSMEQRIIQSNAATEPRNSASRTGATPQFTSAQTLQPTAEITAAKTLLQPLESKGQAAFLDPLVEQSGIALSVEKSNGPETQSVSRSLPSAPTQQTAEHVSRQISAAVSNINGNTTEIRLNPEELGKVRLSLQTSESGLILTVQAERAETNDLLRRHIEVLAKEFQDLGFENLEFSFQQHGEQSSETPENDRHQSEQSNEIIQVAASPDVPPPSHSTTDLDIRL